jgi:hypothetical protein
MGDATKLQGRQKMPWDKLSQNNLKKVIKKQGLDWGRYRLA